MAGTKSSAYLSEEARLQAQRRMLAERYGLSMSDDDSEDDQEPATPPPTSDRAPAQHSAPKRASPAGNANGRGRGASGAAAGAGRSGGDDRLTGSTAPARCKREGASSNGGALPSPPVAKPELAVAGLAQPWLEGSGAGAAGAAWWPGVELASATGELPRVYTYDRTGQRELAAKRQLRVTQVTMYASQFVPAHARKVAVNDRVITYAVGGHVRAIVRRTGVRALLKGHDTAVVDAELLGPAEKLMRKGPGPATGCSVLGSVAEDGAAFVWRLLRIDDPLNPAFAVADAIPIPHTSKAKGARYSRITFRPGSGSVVADNGVGVAVCLIDPDSPDLRVVEMVKMDSEIMIRDKFLEAAEEPRTSAPGVTAALTSVVSACVWLNEHRIFVARDGAVHLWRFEEGTCAGRVPRTAETPVHSLQVIGGEILLVACDEGRTVEVWHVILRSHAPAMFKLNQTVHLAKRKGGSEANKAEPFHGVIGVDPAGEIIAVANARGNFLFALHFNADAKAIDAITEIPMKQPVLSLCVTRDSRSSAQDLSVGVTQQGSVEEISLWCVQPKAVQMVHLNPKDCTPKGEASKKISLSSSERQIPKSTSTNKSELPPVQKSSRDLKLGPGEGNVRKTGTPVKAPLPEDSSMRLKSTFKMPSSEEAANRPPVQPETAAKSILTAPIAKRREVAGREDPNVASSSRGDPAKSKDAEEMADAVLEATKRVIDAFEKAAEERDAAENARVKKLIAKVKADAEKNLELFVGNALKKPMGNAIIPAVSKIVMDMHSRVRNAQVTRPKVTKKMFSQAMDQSNLGGAFKLGCSEMLDQISVAVNKSMESKCKQMIEPPVKQCQDKVANLTKTVDELVAKLAVTPVPAIANGHATVEEVDPRTQATELMKKNQINEAFLLILELGDVELVKWLCSHFDPKNFFESNTLSQVAILALTSQLGQGLGEKDTKNTAIWLCELMLVLEPTNDVIVDTVGPTLLALGESVRDVQKQTELLRENPGLGKELKTLNMVISSLTR